MGNGVQSCPLPSLGEGDSDDSYLFYATAEDAWYFDGDGSGGFDERVGMGMDLGLGTGNTIELTDFSGTKFVFNDFSAGQPEGAGGRLVSRTDPDGTVTSVTSTTSDGKPLEMQTSRTSGGVAVVESAVSTYEASGVNAGKLESVTLRRSVAAGAWQAAGSAEYTYHDGTDTQGSAGDLATVTIKDGAGAVTNRAYYRYYTEGETNGFAGGMKYAVSGAAYDRLVAAVGDPADATDNEIAPFADKYFEYDSQRRVTKVADSGEGCSVCSGGLGTYTYSYATSSNADGPNNWKRKTTETLPDGNQNVLYTNSLGQVMLKVYRETGTGREWPSFTRYDADGKVTLQAGPEALSGYGEGYADLVGYSGGNAAYLRDGDGLVNTFNYFTSTTATDSTAGRGEGRVGRDRGAPWRDGQRRAAVGADLLRPHGGRGDGDVPGERDGVPQRGRDRRGDDDARVHLAVRLAAGGLGHDDAAGGVHRPERAERGRLDDDRAGQPRTAGVGQGRARIYLVHAVRPGHRRGREVDRRRGHDANE